MYKKKSYLINIYNYTENGDSFLESILKSYRKGNIFAKRYSWKNPEWIFCCFPNIDLKRNYFIITILVPWEKDLKSLEYAIKIDGNHLVDAKNSTEEFNVLSKVILNCEVSKLIINKIFM